MRVVGGKAKGRQLKVVPGDTTRPILDRVKTALFDIIRFEIQDAIVLDVFAGTGAVGIEALSQGAKHCTFLDLAKAATKVIKSNVETCELEDQAEIRNTDSFKYIRNTSKSFDLIYVAPPQYKTIWVDMMRLLAERPELLNSDGSIIVQIDPKEYEELQLETMEEIKQKKYGNTTLVFYKLN